ncbi:hypothetical protein GWI33_003258, partial [Rhynchophorus ferrugineus]
MPRQNLPSSGSRFPFLWIQTPITCPNVARTPVVRPVFCGDRIALNFILNPRCLAW